MKYIFLIMLFAFLTLKLTTASSPLGLGGFWDINFIIIYEVDKLEPGVLNELLVHEYQHQLAWELFGIYPKNIYDHNECCFI